MSNMFENEVLERLEKAREENTSKYLITYDLHNKPSKKYNVIKKYLKEELSAQKFLRTVWYVEYSGTMEELKQEISHLFRSKDKFGIIRFHKATRTVVGGNTKPF